MRVPNRFSQLEKAQFLPIVVIGVIVMIAFAALLIDGGAVMLNRRTAQAAADAGALAGAKRACLGNSDAKAVAEDYATVKNNATSATATVSDKTVTVIATVDHPSFFAKIFGQDSDVASAEAIAGCFPMEGNFLLPIGWSCRPPVTGGVFDPNSGCKMMTLDYEEIVKPILSGTSKVIPNNNGRTFYKIGTDIVDVVTKEPPSQIYIIMDKIATTQETLCKEELQPTDPLYLTAIKCDLNNDGKNDIEGGGNRGWLDLNNGGGGASDMRNWIINGLNFPLSPHTWLVGQTGTIPNVYEAIKDYRQGKVVKIPIFTAICNDTDPTNNTACMAAAHLSPWPSGIDSDPSGGSKPKFHVVTFDSFYISCVHTKTSDYCPGFALAQKMNPDPAHPSNSTIPDNTTSVEGFFLSNVDNALDLDQACSLNLGTCQVSLTK